VRAFRIARAVTGADARWEVVERLEGVDKAPQLELMGGVDRLVEETTRWYLTWEPEGDIDETIAAGRDGFERLAAVLGDLGSDERRRRREQVAERLIGSGVPEPLARTHAVRPEQRYAPDMVWVAGATGRPIEEVAEVFFEDVVVPADRMLGEVDGGWAVAMSILPYERSSCFWQRIAYLYRRLQLVVDAAPTDDRAADVVGNAFVQLHGLRARSRVTQHRLAAGETLGAETSIDKVLVATAEQTTYDAARRLLPGVVEMDDGIAGAMWRNEFLYSRAATIYGGTAEVQRNIIARRLLGLGGDE